MGNTSSTDDQTKKPEARTQEQEKYKFVPQENFVNDINEVFEFGKVLGSGGSCSVYIGEDIKTKKSYAVKQMIKDDKWNPKSFKQEHDFLTSLLPHDNILKYVTSYVDKTYFYIVTELCEGGALFNRIRRMKKFSEKQAVSVLRTLIKTIKHCHSRNIVHRDLKPENIVYETKEEDSNIIVIDFGDAARVSDHDIYDEFIGTLFYLPPEIIRIRHGWELKASDMWSIGVIAYVLVSGRPPFYGKDNKSVISKITKGKYYWSSKVKLSKHCKHFIKSLLQLNPHRRLTPTQALKHQWLQEGNASCIPLGNEFLLNINEFYQGNVLEKLIVANVITHMDKNQEMILKNAFSQMDKENNGYITKPLLIQFFTHKLGNKDAAFKKTEQFFKMMDDDHDGKITFHEFKRAKTQEVVHSSKNIIKDTFLALSKNKKNVDIDTFKQWIKDTDKNVTSKQVDNIIKNIDENGDGFIDFHEFKRSLKSMDDLTKTQRFQE